MLADEQFAGAYGKRGKPGWPPGRLALVTVFQMTEDLTDRQAAGAVRTRIDWKYALGLGLADPGFDDSVLSEFRTRVAGGGLDQVVLDTLLQRLAAGGLVAAGGTMRTDSTHVIAAVRDLNRQELAGESVRACLEQLAVAAPHWLAGHLDESRGERYAARIDTWRMPASAAKKAELALAYGRDGHALLKAVYAAAASDPDPAFLARLHQVEVLRVVLLQNYLTVIDRRGREVIKRREADTEVSRRADRASPRRMTSMPGGASSVTPSGTATRCTSPRPAAPAAPETMTPPRAVIPVAAARPRRLLI